MERLAYCTKEIGSAEIENVSYGFAQIAIYLKKYEGEKRDGK